MNAVIEKIEKLNAHTSCFWLKPEQVLRYTAGQFIELTLNHDNPDDRGVKRWFTLSSSPTEPLLAITTKQTPNTGSSFKQALFAAKPGDSVQISLPMGDFVLPLDKTQPLVFVAGGIGVTPFRSMVTSLIDQSETRSITMLYAAENPDAFVYLDTFKQYGVEPIHTVSKPTTDWHEHTGHITADYILEQAPYTGTNAYFVSGPEPMVETITKSLQQSGVEAHHIVSDYFPNYEPI